MRGLRETHVRKGLILNYATLGYNSLEGLIPASNVALDQCVPFIICSCAFMNRCTRSACICILDESA